MKILQVLLSIIFILPWANGEHFTVNGKSRFFNNKALRLLLNNMNPRVDPCTDFYEYVCGNWAHEHVEFVYNSATCMMESDANGELAKAVGLMNYRNKTTFVRNVMDYYNSCTKVSDSFSVSELNNWFEENEQTSWEDSSVDYNWPAMLGVMRRYGMNSIFVDENLYADEENKTKMYINVDKPESRGEDYILTEDEIELLKEILSEDFMTESDWDELNIFEDDLERLYIKYYEDDSNVTTLDELPYNWFTTYMTSVLKEMYDPAFEITVDNPQYFEDLSALFDNTADELIYKYVQVRFIIYLNSTIIDELSDLQCMQMASHNLPLITNWIYEKQHPEIVNEFPKVYEVYNNIYAQVKKSLKSDKSGVFTEKVLEKLEKIQYKIGILPRIDTSRILEDLYSDLKTVNGDFYGNHMRILEHVFNRSHTVNTRYLNTNPTEYFDINPPIGDCHEVYPYSYDALIVLPVTLLRQPYFHWAYSDFAIYSTLGVRMAASILWALDLEMGSEENQANEIAALHIALETFFSNLPEDYENKKTITAMKKVFVLKSSQYFCDDDGEADNPKLINKFIHQSSRFSEIFGCKTNDIINVFAH